VICHGATLHFALESTRLCFSFGFVLAELVAMEEIFFWWILMPKTKANFISDSHFEVHNCQARRVEPGELYCNSVCIQPEKRGTQRTIQCTAVRNGDGIVPSSSRFRYLRTLSCTASCTSSHSGLQIPPAHPNWLVQLRRKRNPAYLTV
jgi:hypothetical protein